MGARLLRMRAVLFLEDLMLSGPRLTDADCVLWLTNTSNQRSFIARPDHPQMYADGESLAAFICVHLRHLRIRPSARTDRFKRSIDLKHGESHEDTGEVAGRLLLVSHPSVPGLW